MIKIYEPYLSKSALEFAFEALNSTWISSQGDFISKATESLGDFVETKNCTLVSNGTVATHTLFHLMRAKFPQIKNIIVPNNVYVAAWNAILLESYEFNITSVDCSLDTWNYDLDELYECISKNPEEETALFVVHNVGNIINVPKIKRDFPNLVILEDNCEGFTGFYENKPSGTESFASSVSFFANKNLTAGEGGAVITKNKIDTDYVRRFINQGNTDTKFVHDILAQNYRMTNIHASILYGQLTNSHEILKLKKQIFDSYEQALSNHEGILFQKQEQNTSRSNWMFGIRLREHTYEELSNFLKNREIETRPMFYCYDRHKHLSGIIKPFKSNNTAKKLNKRAIILPSSPNLEFYEIEEVVDSIFKFLNKGATK